MTNTQLQPGDPAPTFTLPNQDAESVAFPGDSGERTILYFYPEAMTPGCTEQACDFRDSLDSLVAAGYRVLGVSRDAPEQLRQFREQDALTFDLLSDPDHAVHELYGAWGEKNNYGKLVEGVIRSTFVIDEQGAVVKALYNVQARGHVARLRRELGLA